jgi:hypothetical protein
MRRAVTRAFQTAHRYSTQKFAAHSAHRISLSSLSYVLGLPSVSYQNPPRQAMILGMLSTFIHRFSATLASALVAYKAWYSYQVTKEKFYLVTFKGGSTKTLQDVKVGSKKVDIAKVYIIW